MTVAVPQLCRSRAAGSFSMMLWEFSGARRGKWRGDTGGLAAGVTGADRLQVDPAT